MSSIKSVMSTMPSDTFVAKRIGTSVFCTVEGRLVSLHLKTEHTFLLMVTQEPLIVHIGTFKYRALCGSRPDASVSAFTKSFIEAFEATALSATADPSLLLSLSSSAKKNYHNAPPGAAASEDQIGVDLLINNGTTLSSPTESALRGLGGFDDHANETSADVARRSSLVNLHRDKIDAELRAATRAQASSDNAAATAGASSTHRRRSSASGTRSEEELLGEANDNQRVSVRVRFSVFSIMYSVVLELKACPAQPTIREPIVWSIFMDLYRTVAKQRRQIDKYESILDQRVLHNAAAAGGGGGGAAEDSPTSSAAKRVASASRPVGGQSSSSGRKTLGSATTTATSSPRRVVSFDHEVAPAAASASAVTPNSGDSKANAAGLVAFGFNVKALPNPDRSSHHQEQPAVAGNASAPPGRKHNKNPSKQNQEGQKNRAAALLLPPPPPSAWQYSHHCGYLDSTKEATPGRFASSGAPQTGSTISRPTSASTDFGLRARYTEDVLRRSMMSSGKDGDTSASPPVDLALLLHPHAPMSAAQVRGTYSGRQVKPLNTTVLTLSSD